MEAVLSASPIRGSLIQLLLRGEIYNRFLSQFFIALSTAAGNCAGISGGKEHQERVTVPVSYYCADFTVHIQFIH